MNEEIILKFKSEYLSNPDKSLYQIARDIEISTDDLIEIMKLLKISFARKKHYFLNESYFHQIDTHDKAYFLGLIAADGYIRNSAFVLTSKDKDILIKFINEVHIEGNVIYRDDGNFENSGECYSIRFSSKEFVEDLKLHGIYNKKSLSYSKIPNIPQEFLWDYLRGYIDGDGTVSVSERTYFKKGRYYTYPRLEVNIIATKSFIEDVIKTFKMATYSITKSHTPELLYLRISSKKELSKMYPLLYNKYSDAYIQRKKNNWDKYMRAISQK